MNDRAKIAVALLAVLMAATALWVWTSRRAPPQLPPHEEIFKTVDALFTAVTAHDRERLQACEQRLKVFNQLGDLPAPVWQRLQTIIASSHAGQWDSAAHALYSFMQGQRREGAKP
jgi:hypothetical protein